MTILAKTFLSLVGRHFMALTLLSAWHSTLKVKIRLNLLKPAFFRPALQTESTRESFRSAGFDAVYFAGDFAIRAPVRSISVMSVSICLAIAGADVSATALARAK